MAIFKVFEPKLGKLHYRLFVRQTLRILVMLVLVTAASAAGLLLLDESAASYGDKLFNAR